MEARAPVISLLRTQPGRPPRAAAVEVDDTGAVVARQSAGRRVGRFGRTLDAAEHDALRAAVATAAAGQPPGEVASTATSGGASEQVNADGVGVGLDAGGEPPPAAADLVALLRDLFVDLLDHPVAALELDVSGTPGTVTLRHRGEEPLAVLLSQARVRTSVFDAEGAIVDQVSVEVGAPDATVEPGWTHAVDLALAPHPPGGYRSVKVDGASVDTAGDGAPRPAELVWADGELDD